MTMIDPKSPENQLDLFADRMYTKDEMLKAWKSGAMYQKHLQEYKPAPMHNFENWIKTLG